MHKIVALVRLLLKEYIGIETSLSNIEEFNNLITITAIQDSPWQTYPFASIHCGNSFVIHASNFSASNINS